MYFTISSDPGGTAGIVDYPSLDSSFMDGQRVDESRIVQTIRVDSLYSQDAPPGHFEPGKILVVSNRLVEAMKSGGVDNIQTFPALVVGRDGTEWSDYQAVQILNVVRCANLEESAYQVIAPAVDASMAPLCDFDQVEVDPEKVPPGLHLFRLAEQPSVILVSEALVKHLVASKPEGGWMVEFEQVCDSQGP